jgi:uncharacterized caspase-like protein
MTDFKKRRVELISADRLCTQGRQLRWRTQKQAGLAAAARLLKQAAKLYQRASLGETARLVWLEAATCHEAGKARTHAERCEREAKAIPEYWTFRKEQAL